MRSSCPERVLATSEGSAYHLEVPPRFELGNGGFADICDLNIPTELSSQVRNITDGREPSGTVKDGDACPDRVPRPKPAMFIYFIESGAGGPIKIGYARSVEGRRGNLQCGNPVELRLLAYVEVDHHEDEERELHRRFAAHSIRGEWFRRGPEVMAAIEQARAVTAAASGAVDDYLTGRTEEVPPPAGRVFTTEEAPEVPAEVLADIERSYREAMKRRAATPKRRVSQPGDFMWRGKLRSAAPGGRIAGPLKPVADE
jgi:hypothetical protein